MPDWSSSWQEHQQEEEYRKNPADDAKLLFAVDKQKGARDEQSGGDEAPIWSTDPLFDPV